MKNYRVKLIGREDWQEWVIPDDAAYSSCFGWDHLLWWKDGEQQRVWIRHDQVQAIQFTENIKWAKS